MATVRNPLRGWRRFYGDDPLHLLAVVASLALAGYVVSRVADDPDVWWLLVWFLGAVIGHDLVLYPLYALADRPLARSRRRRGVVRERRPEAVSAVNHLRLPAMGAAVVGLVFLPSILGRGTQAFLVTAGGTGDDHLSRWLLVTGVLFLASAVVYAVRRGRPRPARPPDTDAPDTDLTDTDLTDTDLTEPADVDGAAEGWPSPSGTPARATPPSTPGRTP